MGKASRSMGAFLLVPIALAFWAAGPRICLPCVPPYCSGGLFLPGTGLVPANLGGVWWAPYYQSFYTPVVDASNVGIYQLVSDLEVAVAFSLEPVSSHLYLLRLDGDLAAGSTYVLRCDDLCRDESPIETTFQTADEAPVPETLGILEASEPLVTEIRVATISGTCDTPITAAIVDLELQLDPSARAWGDVFMYSTVVDGELWSAIADLGQLNPDWEFGGSWRGRGKDRIYVICASSDPHAFAGVEEGPHTALMRAELPGQAELLESTPVSFELVCPPQEDDDLADAADEGVVDGIDDGGPADGLDAENGGCGCTLMS